MQFLKLSLKYKIFSLVKFIDKCSLQNKQNKCCSSMFFKQHLYCELPPNLKKGEHRARVLPVSLAGPGEWSDFKHFSISSHTSDNVQTTILSAAFTVALIIAVAIGIVLWCYKRRLVFILCG